MTTLTAVVRKGQLELTNPIDLPDGTEVTLRLLTPTETQSCLDDEDPMSPEEIARALAAMAKVQPFERTEEERAAWEADRKARKEWEKARFNEHADKLRRTWE